jgi:hypothetical protein
MRCAPISTTNVDVPQPVVSVSTSIQWASFIVGVLGHRVSASDCQRQPYDGQVGARPVYTALLLDAPASIHRPLQKRLQQQVRASLRDVEPLNDQWVTAATRGPVVLIQ